MLHGQVQVPDYSLWSLLMQTNKNTTLMGDSPKEKDYRRMGIFLPEYFLIVSFHLADSCCPLSLKHSLPEVG